MIADGVGELGLEGTQAVAQGARVDPALDDGQRFVDHRSRITGPLAVAPPAATTRTVMSTKGARMIAMSLRSAAGLSMTMVSACGRRASQ